jgi:purine nucleoside permease
MRCDVLAFARRSALALCFALTCGAAAQATPLAVRVVVVTTFEIGTDTDAVPGEFRAWVERFPLPETIAFPAGYRRLRYDPRLHVLGIVTGEGAERGAASIMGLGLDPRFDLSHAYWVVAGIAGVDPRVASVGSAAWARYVVNGDLAYDVDARQLPPGWSTGIVPLDTSVPFAKPAPPADSMEGTSAYALDRTLADFAYRLTAAVPLADDATLRSIRAGYPARSAARRPPFVLEGDDLAADRFWIGDRMNAWAERWVRYWTRGRATFAMSDEEDAGILQALTFLDHAHRADVRRVLVLRTASDYTLPRRGETIARLLARDAGTDSLSAYRESLEAAYRVGSVVVREIASHWSRYELRIPGVALTRKSRTAMRT